MYSVHPPAYTDSSFSGQSAPLSVFESSSYGIVVNAMSYQLCVLNGLFVVRWDQPRIGDPTKYCQELTDASRRQGKRLVGLFIMPEASTAPNDAFKREQASLLPVIMTNLEYAVAVFEGTGFSASLKRSALVAIILLSGQRQRIHVRASVRDAFTNPAGPITFDADAALQALHARGFCEYAGPLPRGAASAREKS